MKFIKKLALLAAIEATSGTAVVPTAAGAIEVSNVNLTPIEGDEVSLDVVRPFFGASAKIMVTLYRKVAFEVALAGVDPAGTLPGYETLLRGCGCNATNTPATSTVFAPVTDDMQSLSLHCVIDKMLYKMAGARGTVKAVVDAKGVPKLQFEFTGAFVPVEDVASMPAVNFSKFLVPLGVNKRNTTLSFDGYNAACSSFQFDIGNSVVKDDLTSVDSTEITGRESTLNVTMRNVSVATKNLIGMASEGAVVPVDLKHGQTATNTVSFNAPKAQLGKPTFSELNGIQMITIPMTLLPSDVGNDEFTITV